MPGYSLVPVDYQPDFGDVSLVPVDYDPFADEGGIQQAQTQPDQIQTQPVQPQPVQTSPQPARPPQSLETAASQPIAGAPANNGQTATGESWDPDSSSGVPASGQPYNPSVAPIPSPGGMTRQIRCGSNPGHCGVGQAVGAIGDGAYSSLEGVGNALRFVGRSIGLYGPDEINRSDQEIRAAVETIKDGGKLLMDSPEARSVASRVAKEAVEAYWNDELHQYFLLGRLGFGALTDLGPVAAVGDSTRALEKGHNAIEALGKGIIGNRTP